MPRPLHAIYIRNPIKIQNTFVTSVGADLCVGPLRTSRFRVRAHTQVRPYRGGMIAFIDHTSEPGHLYVPRRSYLQFKTPSPKLCAASPRSPVAGAARFAFSTNLEYTESDA